MARRLPSLRPPAEDAGLAEPPAGLRSLNRGWVVGGPREGAPAWGGPRAGGGGGTGGGVVPPGGLVLGRRTRLFSPELNPPLPVPPFFMPIFFVFIPVLGGSLDHPAEIWLPT